MLHHMRAEGAHPRAPDAAFASFCTGERLGGTRTRLERRASASTLCSDDFEHADMLGHQTDLGGGISDLRARGGARAPSTYLGAAAVD